MWNPTAPRVQRKIWARTVSSRWVCGGRITQVQELFNLTLVNTISLLPRTIIHGPPSPSWGLGIGEERDRTAISMARREGGDCWSSGGSRSFA